MNPLIMVTTPSVDDLERALHFYTDGLGFEIEGIFGEEFKLSATVFI